MSDNQAVIFYFVDFHNASYLYYS
ncbi:hypothetical protein D030_1694A, partial [Vibrio parahaemolyticus AQ3810]